MIRVPHYTLFYQTLYRIIRVLQFSMYCTLVYFDGKYIE